MFNLNKKYSLGETNIYIFVPYNITAIIIQLYRLMQKGFWYYVENIRINFFLFFKEYILIYILFWPYLNS